MVLGILLAVQIDRWNEGRERVEVTQRYLDRLARDLEADVDVLKQNAALVLRWSESTDRLLSWMEDASAPPPDVELAETINTVRGGGLAPLRAATYRDLVSGGNVALIRDLSLRDAIISYYERAPDRMSVEIATAESHGYDLFPTMGRHIDDRVLYGPEAQELLDRVVEAGGDPNRGR